MQGGDSEIEDHIYGGNTCGAECLNVVKSMEQGI
jgi:hypothetical protein